MDRCPCCRAKPKGDEKREYNKGVIIMNITITGKDLKATDAIKEYAEKKREYQQDKAEFQRTQKRLKAQQTKK